MDRDLNKLRQLLQEWQRRAVSRLIDQARRQYELSRRAREQADLLLHRIKERSP